MESHRTDIAEQTPQRSVSLARGDNPRGASCDNFDFPVFEPIDTSNYAEFPLLDRRVENRRRRFELRNIVDHILPNGGVEEIAGTLRSSVDCGSDACNQGR